MTRIDLNNDRDSTSEWTMWTMWTPPNTEKISAKLSTILGIFWNIRKRGVSTDYLVDSGQGSLTKCSFIINNNSIIGIFKSFSCVKSVLKIGQFNRIKKFYRCEGVSSMSTMSNIECKRIMIIDNLFTIVKNFYKNSNNNNGKEKELK